MLNCLVSLEDQSYVIDGLESKVAELKIKPKIQNTILQHYLTTWPDIFNVTEH